MRSNCHRQEQHIDPQYDRVAFFAVFLAERPLCHVYDLLASEAACPERLVAKRKEKEQIESSLARISSLRCLARQAILDNFRPSTKSWMLWCIQWMGCI